GEISSERRGCSYGKGSGESCRLGSLRLEGLNPEDAPFFRV
ncbi:hypothetical protein PENNAL_c0399G03569, partial [Penicillium nalgiovense]